MALVVKKPPASAGDIRDSGSVPGSGRSPGGGHGNPSQYSCWRIPMDRGAWRATVYRVAKSQTRPSNWTEYKYFSENYLAYFQHTIIKIKERQSKECITKPGSDQHPDLGVVSPLPQHIWSPSWERSQAVHPSMGETSKTAVHLWSQEGHELRSSSVCDKSQLWFHADAVCFVV